MRLSYVQCELCTEDFHKEPQETIVVYVYSDNDIPLEVSVTKRQVSIKNDRAYIPCYIEREYINHPATADIMIGDSIYWKVLMADLLESI